MRKERFVTTISSNQCLLTLIILVLIIQTTILAVPFYFGFQFVESNRATFKAFSDMDGKEFIDNTTLAIGNGKTVTFKVLDLMKQVKQLTNGVKNKTNIFDDVHHMIESLEKPIDEIGKLLSPTLRKTLMKILTKAMRIMEQMSDSEIHDFITDIDMAIKLAFTHQNVNQTFHMMNDADNMMVKMDKFLAKFTN